MSTEIYIAQLEFNRWALTTNVDDLSHEESLVQPRPAGNCVNWLVGHLVATRNRLLRGLGSAAVWDEADDAIYSAGAWNDGQGAKELAQCVAAFERSQGALRDALGRLSADDLEAPAPFTPGSRKDLSLGDLLSSFCCHEAYHVGQTGLLRRILGHPGKLG